jgi:hypothetical protein
MQYYTFELDKESHDLCTIITPFSKYKYLRIPMGLKCSPVIAQAVMKNVLSDTIEVADVDIDHVSAFSSDWNCHVSGHQSVSHHFTLICKNGFTINPLKCEWAVKENDWLGY